MNLEGPLCYIFWIHWNNLEGSHTILFLKKLKETYESWETPVLHFLAKVQIFLTVPCGIIFEEIERILGAPNLLFVEEAEESLGLLLRNKDFAIKLRPMAYDE